MGLALGDYDRNGTIDIFKTNFAGDTSTLYSNTGEGLCEDHTFASGIGTNTRWLGWGVGFLDLDHDGWLDLFLVNGHVYPEVEQLPDRGGIQAAQGGLSQSAQRAIRGRDRAPRRAADGAAGRARRRLRRLRQRRRRRRRGEQRARHAESVPAGCGAGNVVDRARAGRHQIQPQCHRRARPHRRRWHHARARSPWRRQLLLAERPARPRRPGRGGAHRAGRGAMAERRRRSVAGRARSQDRDAGRRKGRCDARCRTSEAVASAAVRRASACSAAGASSAAADARPGCGSGGGASRADSDGSDRAGAGAAEAVRCRGAGRRVPARAGAVPRGRSREGDRDAHADRLAARERQLERREAEQVLGLALYAGGTARGGACLTSKPRASWARDNIELHYYLGPRLPADRKNRCGAAARWR